MAKAGVTGVFNVQTEIDFEHRGIIWSRMLEYYSKSGITPAHFPIHDFNETDLTEKLKAGADILKEMVEEKGLKVYVHCTAGMGRAPACVVTYLCLYQGMDPDEADLYVKQFRKVSVPNLRAIKRVVA